jgi:hypothetical protein
MGKGKKYAVTLISAGQIVENLHFGPFCHDWWLTRPNRTSAHTFLLPIRLGMKTLTVLNDCNFIITVVKGYAGHSNSPGFFCCSEEKQSGICGSSTEAINACYEEVFRSNAKFPGPPVMGFDNSDVVEQLFSDVIFRPYTFNLGRLNIFVLGMGKSKKPEWNYAGDGYKSIFQCNSNNVRSVYVQELEHEECTVQVFIDDAFAKLYNASDPNKVWLYIDRFSNYTGKVLFGLEYLYTQSCIEQVQIPSCTVLQWALEGVLENLYEYHLKKKTRGIKWRDFFDNWLNQESSIIELRGAILDLYPHNHEISDREWRAWKAFIRHAGCTNINPFKKGESEVNKIKLCSFLLIISIIS